MDPIILSLIAAGASAVGGSTTALILWLRYWRQKQLPPPPPPTPEELEAERQAKEEERKRQEDEERQRQEETARRAKERDEARAREAAQQAAREAAFENLLDHLVATITSSIVFTHKRVPIGYAKVGEEAVGVRRVESRTPTGEIDIRRIRDLSETPLLLATEHMEEDDDTWLERLVTGQALVRVHVCEEQILRPIFEPQFEEKVRVLYLLLDVSPSMFEAEAPWRPPIWKGVVPRLIDKARAVDAPFLMRPFSDGVRDLQRVLSQADAQARKQHIKNMKMGSGTNIEDAIMVAIRDFSKEEYDVADIMILTDGEDNRRMDSARVRKALETANVRLHATLLGVQNEALRACTDSYVIINSDLTVRSVVHRT